MKGVKSSKESPRSSASADVYPGIDAVLKVAQKSNPKLASDREQLAAALQSLLPSSLSPEFRTVLADRAWGDYLKVVSRWRADNWLLPVEKESPFPYVRTPRLVDPFFKYGAKWLAPNGDCGYSYDSEGENIPFSVYMENIARAGFMEESCLRAKGIPTVAVDPTDSTLRKMQSENASVKENFRMTRFDRFEETWKTQQYAGYTILPRFRAFTLYSREQQRLLDAYEANPNHETKKILLSHVEQHGHLIRDCPDPDPPVRKVAGPVAAPVRKVVAHVESAIEVV